MLSWAASPDPYLLRAFGASDNFAGLSYKVVPGAPRSAVIDPTKKTLVLICWGQSPLSNISLTGFVPTNSSVIDNFNIYDGALYAPSANGWLGCTSSTSVDGPGNICPRVMDKLVPTFDRVIGATIAIGSTSIGDWASGDLSNRVPVVLKRLASRGITPSTTGVTFAMLGGPGQQDKALGTSQAAWESSFATFKANCISAGFSGRFFVPLETYDGSTSSTIRAAMSAVVDNTTVFSGGDTDTLTGTTYRQSGAHYNDAGSAAGATIIYNAMHASGSPF